MLHNYIAFDHTDNVAFGRPILVNEIEGMSGLEQGLGLDVRPYASGRWVDPPSRWQPVNATRRWSRRLFQHHAQPEADWNREYRL